MRGAGFCGRDSCFGNEAESDREQTKGRPSARLFSVAVPSIDRHALFHVRLLIFQVRLLMASARPSLDGKGEFMLARRDVRNGRLRHLDTFCDHTGIHDARIDCQIRHSDPGNRGSDSHSRPLGWQH